MDGKSIPTTVGAPYLLRYWAWKAQAQSPDLPISLSIIVALCCPRGYGSLYPNHQPNISSCSPKNRGSKARSVAAESRATVVSSPSSRAIRSPSALGTTGRDGSFQPVALAAASYTNAASSGSCGSIRGATSIPPVGPPLAL